VSEKRIPVFLGARAVSLRALELAREAIYDTASRALGLSTATPALKVVG
jgi:hypothetical protein